MGLNKRYRGYKSFDYLEKDIDYKAFRLAKEVDRVEPYLVPLSTSEEERVMRIVAENPVISIHDHPHVRPEDVNEIGDYSRQDREVTAFEGLSKSCLDCVFDSLPGGRNRVTSPSGWKWTDALHALGIRLSDMAHQDFVIIATSINDILRAHREGKIAFVMAIEGAMPIENELDRIDILYGFGLRVMGLTYSDSNALGTGLREDRDGGLTSFGRKCVERMNKLGMVIDVAHCSSQTILDAVEASSKPIIASHAGARVLCDIKRLMPDHVLRAIAGKGGIVGIEAAPHTTITKKHPKQNIESVMEHFEYIAGIVGIDHVAFGPDTVYGDHVASHRLFAATVSLDALAKAAEFVPYVKGMENPTECSWNEVRWLVKHGYSDEDIAKAIGGNAIRVLKEVWE